MQFKGLFYIKLKIKYRLDFVQVMSLILLLENKCLSESIFEND